ncbi:MAG: alkaline phosphatase family protein, partial [Candidatus Eremiobacteraeota bacterium]|nr:alkaline phosphatase family protein [Candidatus Eremiobacteraeota bacterium]
MSTLKIFAATALCGAVAFAAGCGGSGSSALNGMAAQGSGGLSNGLRNTQGLSAASAGLPHPDHITVLIMENQNYSILLNAHPPYLFNALKPLSAWFTQAYAITHKSQPNYFALFAGTTEGLSGGGQDTDACPPKNAPYNGDVAAATQAQGKRFVAQVENSLPWGQCNSTKKDPSGAPLQVNRHTPWVNFTDVPHSVEHDWSPGSVPDLSADITFLTPNQMDNTHDSTIAYGDNYLAGIIPGIIAYDATHNGLLVILWDEADSDNTNGGGHIATLFVGPMVKPGEYGQTVNHFNVLRTIEDMEGLPHLGNTGNFDAISGVWTGSTPSPSPSPTP